MWKGSSQEGFVPLIETHLKQPIEHAERENSIENMEAQKGQKKVVLARFLSGKIELGKKAK